MECLKHITADSLWVIPSHIDEIARNPDILEFLSRNVNTLFWAGGDVSHVAGDTISSTMKLFTTCGSTEMGMWPTLRPSERWPSEHWKFMRIHPAANVQFRHHTADLYEAYIVRNAQPEDEQPVFKLFTDLQEFNTGDLFFPEPSDPQLWQYRGRTDDMQVFSNGGKYHPTVVESRIEQHPDVQTALLVGTGRPKAALLLEMKRTATPNDMPGGQKEVIEHIWPTIRDANQICRTYAKMTKDHILFTSPLKPMVRSAKGTVQRSKTVERYKLELDELYNKVEATSEEE